MLCFKHLGRLLVLHVLHVLVCGSSEPLQTILSILPSGGLEFKVHDIPGLEEVGFHYNINSVLSGTTPAKNNYEETRKQNDGYWHHKDTRVDVKIGDVVNYWLYYKVNGVGHVQTDLRWIAGSGGHSQTANGHVTSTPVGHGQLVGTGDLRLFYHEDFSSGKIDLTKWYHEVSAFGGGNWEFQIYSPEPANSFVKNGILYIKPTLTADKFGENFLYHGVLDVQKEWGVCTRSEWYGCLRNSKDSLIPPAMSAKLISKFAFKYGRMEVVAKMPLGDWLWPTIWLWPKDEAYGGWPRSGEIDLVETRGNIHYGNIGINRIMSTLHWGPKPEQDSWAKTTDEKFGTSGNWADDFHTYYIDWDENGIVLGVDGQPILNRPTPRNGYFGYGGFSGSNPWTTGGSDAPFDKEMIIQLNVAVGGTNGFFPDNVQNAAYPKPWCNSCPDAAKSNQRFWEAHSKWHPTWHGDRCAMQIKDIKVWTRA